MKKLSNLKIYPSCILIFCVIVVTFLTKESHGQDIEDQPVDGGVTLEEEFSGANHPDGPEGFGGPHDHIRPGFSGKVDVGLVYENFDADYSAGDDQGELSLRAMFDLQYGTDDANSAFYLRSPLQSIGEELSLGVLHKFENVGRLHLSISTSLSNSVEQNIYEYYLEGTEEEDFTVENRVTYSLSLTNILKSHFGLSYTYKTVDVENDNQVVYDNYLARDGIIKTIGLDYGLGLAKGQRVAFEASYSDADMEGDSNSYDGIGLKTQYSHLFDQLIFEISLDAEKNHYKKENPIFNKIQEDTLVGTQISIRQLGLFGKEDLSLGYILGAEKKDSNIRYFDSVKYSAGVTFGVNF